MCIAVGAYLGDFYVLRWYARLNDLPLVGFPQIKISFALWGFVVDIAIRAAEGIFDL